MYKFLPRIYFENFCSLVSSRNMLKTLFCAGSFLSKSKSAWALTLDKSLQSVCRRVVAVIIIDNFINTSFLHAVSVQISSKNLL